MTALSNAAVPYSTLEGTSTVFPFYSIFEYSFHPPASTTLFLERELSEEAIDTIVKLKSFLRLQDNWDSYGAAAPQKDIIEQAISFVKSLDQRGQEVFFTAPGPNGEILVEVTQGEKTIETTISEDGGKSYASFHRTQCVEEGNLSDLRLPLLLQWLREL
jgi:hypothetical protein